MDVVFPRFPCDLLGLDVQDIMGTHLVDITGTLMKKKLSAEGEVVGEGQMMFGNFMMR